jgi:DNA-binding phage protein
MEQLVRVPGRAMHEKDARIDPDLAAFHQAIVHSNNPAARRMFELQFLVRCNVSHIASQVGISRTHWYRIVNSFARQVYSRSIGEGY